MSMRIQLLPFLLFIPFCSSSLACATNGWREGFVGNDTLQLVGEGHAKADLPQVQAEAMAREAALIDALSHWPKYCGENDAASFRIENQKRRRFECDGSACRARVVIQKSNLREKCAG